MSVLVLYLIVYKFSYCCIRSTSTASLNVTSSSVLGLQLVLDLLATVTKLGEARSDSNEVMFFLYTYERGDVCLNLEFLPLSEDYSNNILSLEFIFAQYTNFIDKKVSASDDNTETQPPSLLVQGIENLGVGIRQTLKSTGHAIGGSIRWAGQHYTAQTSPTASPQSDRTTIIPQKSIDDAEYVKRQATRVNTGAKHITSAALVPVRWAGQHAAQQSTGKPTPESIVPKVVIDTVGGLGNAVSSIYKGTTELLGEVGSAISDTAIHHSTVTKGDAYAELVTRRYLQACGEVGKAGYIITNIALLGIPGIIIDAVLEGSTQYFQLYEYLLGPVLVQGYIELVQLPFTQRQRVYAVLRPWSINFYLSASEITKKPFKVIPISMLDTLPVLKVPGQAVPTSNQAITYVASPSKETKEAPPHSPPSSPSLALISSVLKSLDSDPQARVEICTIDGSTCYLYLPVETLNEWFEAIKAASTRTETMSNRKQVAKELAVERRLSLMPKKSLTLFQPLDLYLATKPDVLDHVTRLRGHANLPTFEPVISSTTGAPVLSASSSYVEVNADTDEFEAFFAEFSTRQPAHQYQQVRGDENEGMHDSVATSVPSVASPVSVQGHPHSAPGVTTSPRGSNITTTLQEARLSIGRYLDPVRNSALSSVRIQVTPKTASSVLVRKEQRCSCSADVRPTSVLLPGSSQGIVLTASWPAAVESNTSIIQVTECINHVVMQAY